MSERAEDRIWSGIDIPKTIAGVLAAVSAAVLGSFLGVAGTLAGAAVASVVGSVGTELYRKFIDRSHKKIVATFVTAPAAVGTPGVTAAASELPSQPEPEPEPAGSLRIRWRRVALVAAGVFVLAMGTLTVFETISGKSASEAVGHHTSSGSTLGSLFGGHPAARVKPTPAPSSGHPSTATTGSSAPAATGTGTTPSAAPTQTTAPTPAPTATDTQNSGTGSVQQNSSPQP
jgi:hypothetical protein